MAGRWERREDVKRDLRRHGAVGVCDEWIKGKGDGREERSKEVRSKEAIAFI